MKRTYNIEVMVGVFLVLGALAFLMLVYKVSGFANYGGNASGYAVAATFDNVGDLKVRAPVTMAGVRIGYVKSINLDPKTYRAKVQLYIQDRYHDLPTDSSAAILTAGLLGANYICLEPGYSHTALKNGDTIQNTNSALILENLIGQLLFKVNESK